MPRNVHVAGISDGLKEALQERLKRSGATIVEGPDEAEIIVGIDQKEDCDIAIIPVGSIPPKSPIVIELNDVMIPNGSSSWGNEVMVDWIRQIKSGGELKIESRNRFWVNVRDVTDAISSLCMNIKETNLSGTFRMCGRRKWSCKDVIDEIRILWERYNNSINHSHTVESLSEVPSPVRGIYSERSETPEFGGLHQALIAIGAEGWHPLVPMRVSLMEMIAHTD